MMLISGRDKKRDMENDGTVSWELGASKLSNPCFPQTLATSQGIQLQQKKHAASATILRESYM